MSAAVSDFGHVVRPSSGSFAESDVSLDSVSRMVEAMKSASKEILNQMASMGAAAAQASFDAMKAIWALVLRIARALFGILKPGSKQEAKPSETDQVKTEDQLPPAQAAKNLVDGAARELEHMVGNANDGSPASKAFLDALRYAGLEGLGMSMVELANDPATFLKADGSEVLSNALANSSKALEGLDAKIYAAQADRASGAAELSKNMVPPVTVETMAKLYRSLQKAGKVSDVEQVHVDQLLAADDTLNLLVAHKNAISEGVALMAASAKNSGLDIDSHREALKSLLGQNWSEKVHELIDMLSRQDSVATQAKEETATLLAGFQLNPKSTVPDLGATGSAPILPAKPESAAALRLRQTSLRSQEAGGLDFLKSQSFKNSFDESNEDKGDRQSL